MEIKSSGITPVEYYGGVYFKRDDLALVGIPTGHPNGSKMRQFLHMVQGTADTTPIIVGCASASAMQVYVASAATLFNRPSHVFVPQRKTPSRSTQWAVSMGAGVQYVRPGYMSVLRARARDCAAGYPGGAVRWDVGYAVQDAANQTTNIPTDVKRLVVPVGSGLTLAGVLLGLANQGRAGVRVKGVAVSGLATVEAVRTTYTRASTAQHGEAYDHAGRCPKFRLVRHAAAYNAPVAATLPGGDFLDPYYAAKAMPWVSAGCCLWVPGVRPREACG